MNSIPFTLEHILEAHQKYTGVDFPRLIQEFKKMGITENVVNIKDGVVSYIAGEQVITSEGIRVKEVALQSSKVLFKEYLSNHQKGQTDFPTFCEQVASAGVYKWSIDLEKMLCIYYDAQENSISVEKIPMTNCNNH